jgi:hypothetical protein
MMTAAVLACALVATASTTEPADAPLPVIKATIEPIHLPVGDASAAVLSRNGWVGSSWEPETNTERVVVERPGASKPALVTAVENFSVFFRRAPGDVVYVNFAEQGGPRGWLARVDGVRAVRLAGTKDANWFVDTPAGLRAVRWQLVDREDRWRLYAVGKKGLLPLGGEHRDEMAFGLVAPPGELLVAAGKSADKLPPTPTPEQKQAMRDILDKGDGRAAARLFGPAPGYLLHLTLDGKLWRQEPFPGRRPEGIALTDDGWLVVIGEGTLPGALRDATVVARRATAAGADPAPWRLLANDIVMPFRPIQRGGWVCFEENPRDTAVIHCINPGRALHVVSPRLTTPMTIFDIDLRGPNARVVFRQSRNDGSDGDHTFAMPLP